MRKAVLIMGCCVFVGCIQKTANQENENENPNPNDDMLSSTSTEIYEKEVEDAFNRLKSDSSFISSFGFEIYEPTQTEFHETLDRTDAPILFGDLNGDGISDAIAPFMIEGWGGGNNWTFHYAVFIHVDGQWIYQSYYSAGGSRSEELFEIEGIENGVVKGHLTNQEQYDVPDISMELVYHNGVLNDSFIALHKDYGRQQEYLGIYEILMPDKTVISIRSTLDECQQLLGKGNLVIPEDQPECGKQFDADEYRELRYPNLMFEVSNTGEIACSEIMMKGSDFKVQSTNGTITEETTLNSLMALFNDNGHWWVNEEEDGTKMLIIPEYPGYDNQWHLYFDADGKIDAIRFFVPC